MNSDLISQIQQEFLFAGFQAPDSFASLPPLNMKDRAWRNCMDDQWFTTVEALNPVDLHEKPTWERFLRFSYCKEIRDRKYFEYVFDVPVFRSVDGEPD